MVKAKDLLGKTSDEFEDDPLEKKSPKKEEDSINEAYESINKRLEELKAIGKIDKNEPKSEIEDFDEDDADEGQREEEEEESQGYNEEEEVLNEDSEEFANAAKAQAAIDPENKEELSPKATFIKPKPPADPLDDEDISEEEIDEEDEEDENQNNNDNPESFEELASEEDKEDQPAKREINEDELPKKRIANEYNLPLEHEELNIPPISASRGFNQPRLPESHYDQLAGSPIDREDNSFKYSNSKPRSSSKWHLLILVLIGIGVIGATVYLLKNQFQPSPDASPSSTPSTTIETPKPTPTPTPLDRSKFKVKVLNGTNESGLAGTISEKLKTLGYQTEKAANAPKRDVKQTLIKVKPTSEQLLNQLIKDLSPDHLASPAGELKESDLIDAEITLGTE